MGEITDYMVVSGESPKDITSTVKGLLKEGWVPLGPAFTITGSSRYAGAMDPRLHTLLAQTLVKY